MIRTLWFYVVLAVATVVHGVAAIGAGLLGVRHRPRGVYDWSTQDWARWILRAAGTPPEVRGLEWVPAGPVVFASNHSSMFDIWVLSAVLPGSVRFVGKAELGRIPLLGPAMRRAGHIMIDRFVKTRAFAAYDRAAAAIRSGLSAVVFPEGTRTRTGELLPFKNAPFALAIAAQAPIVPVYVHDTFRILPKGGWRLRPQPIRVRIAPPVETAGLTADDRDALRERVRGIIVDLRARVDAGSAAH
jgi:1-acyl-sn-glycerol-3-phosphate acyltransferase